MSGLLLAKALAQLILPPGGLVLLALLGLLRWRRLWGMGLVALSLLLLYALATEPVKDALLQPLEFKYAPLSPEQALPPDAAIVLLGGGVYARAPEYGGKDRLKQEALMRTLYAAGLARRTGLPVYASGGRVLSDTEAEGAIMRRLLIRLGVAAARVHAETKARNTWENAVYMRRMLQQAGIERIVLVTSAVHMPRAVFCFKSQGLAVIPAPCAYRTGFLPYDVRGFLPHWRVLADAGDALHEYLGYLWYMLRFF